MQKKSELLNCAGSVSLWYGCFWAQGGSQEIFGVGKGVCVGGGSFGLDFMMSRSNCHNLCVLNLNRVSPLTNPGFDASAPNQPEDS